MNLEHATLLFLVTVFLMAEIYRVRRQTSGRIIRLDDGGIPVEALPMMSVLVKLRDGREVAAALNSCTACLGRLKIGDEVRVSRTRDGWVVDLPWLRLRRCRGRGEEG